MAPRHYVLDDELPRPPHPKARDQRHVQTYMTQEVEPGENSSRVLAEEIDGLDEATALHVLGHLWERVVPPSDLSRHRWIICFGPMDHDPLMTEPVEFEEAEE